MLLKAGRRLVASGHVVSLVATSKAADHEAVAAGDFEAWASAIGAEFIFGPQLASAKALETLRAARCDVAISMNWVRLLPAEVRACFTHGVFNAHPGDLPRFKGNACPNWAILLGEPGVGLIIHKMDDGLDSGPVALRDFFPLAETTTVTAVYAWLEAAIPRLFVELANAIADGRLVLSPQSQDPSLGLRCYPRRAQDARIDWCADSAQISRLIRASTRPFAGAFTTLEGQQIVRVWSAAPVEIQEPFVAIPGQVMFALQGDPVVATGRGALRLTDISLDGASSLPAREALLVSLRNRLV